MDRITEVRIGGLRAIEQLTLDVAGLIALIGDNGSGKSCIIEALQILQHASKPLTHVSDVLEKRHGGLRSLLRRGAAELTLGVSIESSEPDGEARIDYDFAIANVGTYPRVIRENAGARGRNRLLSRNTGRTQLYQPNSGPNAKASQPDLAEIGEQALALPWVATRGGDLRRLVTALSNIVVHVPFETRPTWQHAELGVTQGPRWPSMLEQAHGLDRYGTNLPNAYQLLRNRGGSTWDRVIQRARLGLGDDLRDFALVPVGRGQLELQVLFGAFPDAPLPSELLSEGQLAYLCFVALMEFQDSCSLLAFDEPEVHLHPQLLARVAWMMEEASTTAPVLVATHSDQFLDALETPESSVRLCTLDERRATKLSRPNHAHLTEWLKAYRGIGSIRSAGYESHVFDANGSGEALA